METHSELNGVTHFWGFLRKCNYYKMKVYLLLFKTLRVRGCSGHKYCYVRPVLAGRESHKSLALH